MAIKHNKVPLENSEVIHPAGARPTRQVLGGQRFRVTLVLHSSPLPQGHPVAKKIKRLESVRSNRRPTLTARNTRTINVQTTNR